MRRDDGLRLVVSDVEGCVIPVGGGVWDHEALAALAAYNAAAREGRLPPLTLCSGRPAQFVEAVGSAIGLFVPAVCENGAVLFDPRDKTTHLLFDESQRDLFARIAEVLRRRLEAPGWARVPRGKEICVTVVPAAGRWRDIRDLLEEVRAVLAGELGIGPEAVNATYSSGAVDLTPAGVDKAGGVRHLLRLLEVEPHQVLAVGDGGNDLPMLELAGVSAAPSNARHEVAGVVDFLASQPEARGLVEILSRFTPFSWPPAAPSPPR